MTVRTLTSGLGVQRNVWMALALALTWVSGCRVGLNLPLGTVVSCSSDNLSCPSPLSCVPSLGRCLVPSSSCLSAVGDGSYAPASEGLVCQGVGIERSVCVNGSCEPSSCGDGRVDSSAGEVCDDGLNNREEWGIVRACNPTCTGFAPFCGDTARDPNEACDDGFNDACGTCNSTCSAFGTGAACGDGLTCPEVEDCDVSSESEVCDGDCTRVACGDGYRNRAVGEVCDDGALNSSAWALYRHCNTDCTAEARYCGDGTVDPEELCDEGKQSESCESNCQVPRCGDGVLNTMRGEACDTGGPSASCTEFCQPRKSIAMGNNHTCIVRDQGVYCFGSNANAESGAQNPASVGDPLSTMGGNLKPLPIDANVDTVVAGLRFTCVRTTAGAVACFGDNQYGATGAGTPYVDLDGAVVLDLAAGRDFVCALRETRDVVCWGQNSEGQLGRGTTEATIGTNANEMGAGLVPVALGTNALVKAIYAGETHTCALLDDGRVKCWGSNFDGELGLGDATPRGKSPAELGDNLPVVELPARVASLSAGLLYTCALGTNGRVYCWGRNNNGNLGQGLPSDFKRGKGPLEMGQYIPSTPLGDRAVARLSWSAYHHLCVLFVDGGVKCFGGNNLGELGLGDARDRGLSVADMGLNLPWVDLGTGQRAVEVSSGGSRTCARLENGSYKCWGSVNEGGSKSLLGRPYGFPQGDAPKEMGDNLKTVPLEVECGNGIIEEGEACDDGYVDACGSCNATCTATGQASNCGDGALCAEQEQCDPALDDDCSGLCTDCPLQSCLPRCETTAACGDGFICEGSEVCEPSLGDIACMPGCTSQKSHIAVGLNGTCHVASDGRVRCFGVQVDEQLGHFALRDVGDDPGEMAALPIVALGQSRRVVSLHKHPLGRHTCVLLSDRTVKCWGLNSSGQLGQGDLVSRGHDLLAMGDTLRPISLGANFVPASVSVGQSHACAVSTTGFVKCWGSNLAGQLGQGVVSDAIGGRQDELGDALPPIRLGANFVAQSVAAGGEFTCVLSVAGRVRCFGLNDYGQLGYGNTTSVGTIPAQLGPALQDVPLGTTNGSTPRRALKLAVGTRNACVILEPAATPDSNIKCWGRNFVGMLGQSGSDNDARGDNPNELGDNLPAINFGGPEAKDVSVGNTSICALFTNGGVRCWGHYTHAQLGVTGITDITGDEVGEVASHPNVELGTGLLADAVSAGAGYACARITDGRFKCWGDNRGGALGYDSAEDIYGDAPGELGDGLPFVLVP